MSNAKENIIWYKLEFKQLSPIHIGQKNYGVLSETRLFIPGWTMWGALVNSYGRLNGGKDKKFDEGKKLFERITCFYPNTNGKKIMFSNFKNGRLYMGDIYEKEFRRRFTDTFVSTAIESKYLVAKDASLHETEIILPKSKKEKESLYWIGLVGIDRDDEENFKKFIGEISEIYVGGDITYGFGKMEVVKSEKNKVDEVCFNEWGLNKYGKIDANNQKCIRNYIEFNNDYKIIKGKLEFIVQYDFSRDVPSIETKGYYFVPGSEIFMDNKKYDFQTLKKGVFGSKNRKTC